MFTNEMFCILMWAMLVFFVGLFITAILVYICITSKSMMERFWINAYYSYGEVKKWLEAIGEDVSKL